MRGSTTEILIRLKENQRLKKVLNEILMKHTGKNVEQIERDCDRDNFMSSDEAKAYGLVDNVLARLPGA
jgi:ATP-dependent Clp protease protease subunit